MVIITHTHTHTGTAMKIVDIDACTVYHQILQFSVRTRASTLKCTHPPKITPRKTKKGNEKIQL